MALISTRRALLGGLRGLDAIPWLLRDEFWDTRAAGAVNGTPATPGPGTRGTIETNGTVSVGSGVATVTGTGGADASAALFYTTAFVRTPGRLVLTQATFPNVVAQQGVERHLVVALTLIHPPDDQDARQEELASGKLAFASRRHRDAEVGHVAA